MKLTTAEQLAEDFGIAVERLHELRRRHGWPCVKFGRSDFRFTDEQIAAIVAMHTVEEDPYQSELRRLTAKGLTPGSARAVIRRRERSQP